MSGFFGVLTLRVSSNEGTSFVCVCVCTISLRVSGGGRSRVFAVGSVLHLGVSRLEMQDASREGPAIYAKEICVMKLNTTRSRAPPQEPADPGL